MSNILGYARVSTDTQDLESQRHRLREKGAIRIFEDVISGKSFERPGLSALIDFAREGDLICVVRLDRLGRSLHRLLGFVQLLKEKKIGIISLEENIDTSSAAGELIFHIFGVIAHFEARLISERTKEGVETARRKGKNIGRPVLSAEKIESLNFLLKNKNMSKAEIARQLNIGKTTLYKYIKGESFCH